MGRRALPWTGVVVAVGLAALILGTLAMVAWQAQGLGRLGPWDVRAVWFTLWQAALSATLSVLLAIPVARALARRVFPGRDLLVLLMGAPFILPVIVAVMGLVAVFGRRGLINSGLAELGLPAISIYGWQGVILAHVFFNLPLSVRLILQGWQAIPAERFRLASSLGFQPSEMARHLERPMLRAVAPGAWLAVFLVCLNSFAVALTLGGGPRATTVELAIYQAFRFDFDMGRAATLALVQVGLSVVAMALAARVTLPTAFGAGFDRATPIIAPRGWRGWGDALTIAAAGLFLLVPMAAIIIPGVPGLISLSPSVWLSAARSIGMALTSTALTLLMGLALSLALAPGGRRWIEAAGMLPLVASPLVLGTGIYLAVRGWVVPETLALPVTVIVNAVMALPFALRALIPAAKAVDDDFGRLSTSLGMTGWARLRWVTLPRMARPLGFAAGLAAALSMGDLGVITLFSGGERTTLPMQLFLLMGRYRMADAASAAVLLMAISFALFWLFDKWGRRYA
ncbi:MAG: thiamine/thiamine pyrophosphate ABC transporter permease ThiP [Paracoccus denitrificans]|nr:MAG: thiamine/thiamine pyrophosphate ABC transporter permease ThiP [Paracoccus denitrificans]PZO83729.1 MAG: thiamine/thiamine pyrophosphate ABC transporter permease ThiP [Paracoccus denitrificans]